MIHTSEQPPQCQALGSTGRESSADLGNGEEGHEEAKEDDADLHVQNYGTHVTHWVIHIHRHVIVDDGLSKALDAPHIE